MTEDERTAQGAERVGEVAARVTTNEGRILRGLRRQRVLAAFVVLVFLFLSWRTQTNLNLIREAQKTSCAQGAEYLFKFNRLQDRLIEIDRIDTSRSPAQREARINAREAARILPLPSCQ